MLRCGPTSGRWSLFLCSQLTLALALCGVGVRSADAYALEGKSWPSGSTITLQLGLGVPALPLTDGNTSWNAAVLPVLTAWNQQISRAQLTGVMNSTAAAAQK